METMTDPRVIHLFSWKQVVPEDIKYILRIGQRTILYLLDGREVSSSLPVSTIKANLPESDFWNIQKGVVVSAHHTVHIDDDGIYTMIDGRKFQGRKRNLAEHKRRRIYLTPINISESHTAKSAVEHMLQQCRLMDDAPIAFCVIELLFAEDGHSIDFVFRYCNQEMEAIEGHTVSEMMNHSLYSIFPGGDKKWIVPYADVALNGTRRIVHDYSREVDKVLTIRCFQPLHGYCACMLTEDPSQPNT